MYTLDDIKAVDPEIAAAIVAEHDRQNDCQKPLHLDLPFCFQNETQSLAALRRALRTRQTIFAPCLHYTQQEDICQYEIERIQKKLNVFTGLK